MMHIARHLIEEYTIYYQLYMLFVMVTMLVLIRLYKNSADGYEGIEESMTSMVKFSLIWPYVFCVWALSWVRSWSLFTWEFWLSTITLPDLSKISFKIPSPWSPR